MFKYECFFFFFFLWNNGAAQAIVHQKYILYTVIKSKLISK